jgi:uncharacterized RmlC-like cupin family protein
LQIVRIPPGVRSKAQKHEGHESAIYILRGESGMWYGESLQHHVIARAGDFLYIPADMPHLPYNPSDTASCVALVARSDPNDQESVFCCRTSRTGRIGALATKSHAWTR